MPFEVRWSGAAAICVCAWQSGARQFDGRALLRCGLRDADFGRNRMLRRSDVARGAAATPDAANQRAVPMRTPARRTRPALDGRESARRREGDAAGPVDRPAYLRLEPPAAWIARAAN